MKSNWRTVPAACALALGCVGGAAQADVVNGGFEAGLAPWTASGFLLQGYDYGVDAMAYAGNSAFYGGGVVTPGLLSQTVVTVPNRDYALTFVLANDGFQPNEFTVFANGLQLLQLTDVGILPYQPFKVFLPTSLAATTLQFGFRNDSGLFHLDQVALQVPEPATALLVSMGLIGVLGARRGRKPGPDRSNQA